MPRAAKKQAATRTSAQADASNSGRRVVYSVAMSLDGYIAGPKGEYDWIVMDPDIDFKEMFERYDTFLLGRKTFAMMAGQGQGTSPGTHTVVFSRTLKQSDHPKVQIVSDDPAGAVRLLKQRPGKDIWLFGGGELFQSLLALGVVDAVRVALVPVVIGGGVPFLPAPAQRTKLRLTNHRLYPKSGIVVLDYDVV